jgi:hypothetical protein
VSRATTQSIPPERPAAALTHEGVAGRVKKPAPLRPFSPYNLFYYCPLCARWVEKERALRDAGGRPVCPYCLNYLRTRPRSRRRWRE